VILRPGVRVPRWSPEVHLARDVASTSALDAFGHRAPAGYDAPAVTLAPPQDMVVQGGSFVALGAVEGPIVATHYLATDAVPDRLLSDAAGSPRRPHPVAGPVLLAGNAAAANYYHWTAQCLAAALHAPTGARLLVPVLRPWQRAGLALAGIDPARLVEIEPDAVALATAATHTNLTGGDFAFMPHPAILDAFARLAEPLPPSPWRGAKVYVARRDAARRALANENAIEVALAARGFATVAATALTIAEQAALFRDAALIVGAHGAALTNLLWTRRGGPALVELHRADYLNRCYTRLAQAKGLRYAALVSPGGNGGRSDGGDWTADLPLLRALLDRWGG